jgi:hypothetical protein
MTNQEMAKFIKGGAPKVRFVILNGIRTDGEGNIDKGRDRLVELGLDVVDVVIPRRNTITARWTTERDARGAIVQADLDDHVDMGGLTVLLAHSRGGLLAGWLQNRGYGDLSILANPAMDRDYKWKNPQRVVNFHSPDDRIVDWLARIAGAIWNDFGDAGSDGFKQAGVENIMVTHGHNGVWDVYLDAWVDAVLSRTVDLMKQKRGA